MKEGEGMISKYGIFTMVVETGSFTRTAELCGYSQSAVSQAVKNLEAELEHVLIERRKDGVRLTGDGKQFYPYIQSIYRSEQELEQKKQEMCGLLQNTITIGTFTGVSRSILPPIIQSFKAKYPHVQFVLQQGEYSNINQWIREGTVDFGFLNEEAAQGVEVESLYSERMQAVLSREHPLANRDTIELRDLADSPFILLDEGECSVPQDAFQKAGIHMEPAYKVYDDYTILSMVRQNLGVSLLYENVLSGYGTDVQVVNVAEAPARRVALAWKQYRTVPAASKLFISHIRENLLKEGSS